MIDYPYMVRRATLEGLHLYEGEWPRITPHPALAAKIRVPAGPTHNMIKIAGVDHYVRFKPVLRVMADMSPTPASLTPSQRAD